MLGRRYPVECELPPWHTITLLNTNRFLLKSAQRIAKYQLGVPVVTNMGSHHMISNEELFIVATIAAYKRKQCNIMKINIILYDSPLQLVKITVRRMLRLHLHPVLSASSSAPSWGQSVDC